MNFVGKLMSPEFYRQQTAKFVASAAAYYRPMFRAGSITPLWHFMAITSLVMYTASYVGYKGPKVAARRLQAKTALSEYKEKHGISDH
eukprot:CAMPEP_0116824518 /NCGR_PEP_ID=MMETSP0418-20121206/1445_1 /TAXON_ID=1158023 /ORGANISM="Astrosyne radiata, Strain 13vi08-1A" /LENGTH=87 /DNA_ID=CAMNT_0004452905 /DNA_START=53 /DNA_END=316 /DNA_ORIENTATION=-